MSNIMLKKRGGYLASAALLFVIILSFISTADASIKKGRIRGAVSDKDTGAFLTNVSVEIWQRMPWENRFRRYLTQNTNIFGEYDFYPVITAAYYRYQLQTVYYQVRIPPHPGYKEYSGPTLHFYENGSYITVIIDHDVKLAPDVPEPPQSGFSANPTSGEAPLEVSFTNSSSGDITSYSWQFGDGGMSSAENPVYPYEEPGTYTVTLTVTGPGGSDTETKTNYISVAHPPPLAGFNASPTSGGAPLEVFFTDFSTGTITAYSWDFGDGGTSGEKNPSYEYTEGGKYTVTLIVTGPGGSDTETKTDFIVVIASAPMADFTASPTGGLEPLTVDFTDSSIGEITSFSWDFGDGGKSSDRNPNHVYRYAGDYTVSLSVTGPDGSDVETKNDYIKVSARKPVAEFSANTIKGQAPLNVDFRSLCNYTITSYSWQFGDGGMSSAENPVYLYEEPGTYTVTLTVTGPGGSDTETKAGYINALPEPTVEADFETEIMGENFPIQVTFQSTSSGDIESYNWYFGDGKTAGGKSPRHIYRTPGSYTVTLVVTGKDGTEDTASMPCCVRADWGMSDPCFRALNKEGWSPLTVEFVNESKGPVTSYTWVFGDGGVSYNKHPIHTYETTGTYEVIMVTEGLDGIRYIRKTDCIVVLINGEIQAAYAQDEAVDEGGVLELIAHISGGPFDNYGWLCDGTEFFSSNLNCKAGDGALIIRDSFNLSDYSYHFSPGHHEIKFRAGHSPSSASLFSGAFTITVLENQTLTLTAADEGRGYSVERGIYEVEEPIVINKDFILKGRDRNPENTVLVLGENPIVIGPPEKTGYGVKSSITVLIEGVTITGFKGEDPLGPIQNFGGRLIISNCRIVDNAGVRASAVYNDRGSLLYAANTLVAGNANRPDKSRFTRDDYAGLQYKCGALFLEEDSTLYANHLTIADNRCTREVFPAMTGYGRRYINADWSAVYADQPKDVFIQNSICWGNYVSGEDSDLRIIPKKSTSVYLYKSCFGQKRFNLRLRGYYLMYEDPLFRDPSSCDYSLDPRSPCAGYLDGGKDIGACF